MTDIEKLSALAAKIRADFKLTGKPCDCSTINGALHYGRAQGVEMAIAALSPSAAPDLYDSAMYLLESAAIALRPFAEVDGWGTSDQRQTIVMRRHGDGDQMSLWTRVRPEDFGRAAEVRKAIAALSDARDTAPTVSFPSFTVPLEPSPIKSPHSDGVFKKPDAQPSAPELSEAIEWTAELETARVGLCEFWVRLAGTAKATTDAKEASAHMEVCRRAIETEQALTILGDIARRGVTAHWTTEPQWGSLGAALCSRPGGSYQWPPVGGAHPGNREYIALHGNEWHLPTIAAALSPAYPDPIALKFAQGHGWAQPGDHDQRAFMLVFDDPDTKKRMYWDGEDAQERALDAWRQYAPSWSCTLFAAVRTVKP